VGKAVKKKFAEPTMELSAKESPKKEPSAEEASVEDQIEELVASIKAANTVAPIDSDEVRELIDRLLELKSRQKPG
jgi:hypothetical protein